MMFRAESNVYDYLELLESGRHQIMLQVDDIPLFVATVHKYIDSYHRKHGTSPIRLINGNVPGEYYVQKDLHEFERPQTKIPRQELKKQLDAISGHLNLPYTKQTLNFVRTYLYGNRTGQYNIRADNNTIYITTKGNKSPISLASVIRDAIKAKKLPVKINTANIQAVYVRNLISTIKKENKGLRVAKNGSFLVIYDFEEILAITTDITPARKKELL